MKRLLNAGVIGPLLFILLFLIEGLTRPGYSQWRNFVSQLATDPGGWLQTANFLMCGVLVLGCAFGLRASLRGTRGSVGAPVLLGLFGIALVAAGTFVTDPALGYPVGAPPAHTGHGLIHGLAGLAAFTLLPTTAFVMAWHFAAMRESRWVVYSTLVGAVILVLFVAMNTTATLDQTSTWPNAPTGFLQRIAIISGWTWISMVSWHQLHSVRRGQNEARLGGSAASSTQLP